MRVAREAWEEHGVDGISVEEICARAGVSRGTFYSYFYKKEHLVVFLLFYGISIRWDDIEALLASDRPTLALCVEVVGLIAAKLRGFPKPIVLRGVEECFSQYGEMKERYGVARALSTYFEPIFERGIERGEVSPTWEGRLLSQAMSWMTLQGMFLWANGSLPDGELERNLRHRTNLIVAGALAERAVD
ncbi:MAG: TetR/AcrR family transcriptional regulator [Alphaproteobacteria bacterium]|nr:TetR/AcrR family transcriptional regulator [Alphaproteobacteria bacterium]